jgi:hypothetical protein
MLILHRFVVDLFRVGQWRPALALALVGASRLYPE